MKTLKVLLQEVVSGIKAWVNSNFAQESNTVHKTGNETVNGVKTFTGVTYKNALTAFEDPGVSGYDYTPGTYKSVDTFIHRGSDHTYWGGLKHNWLTDGTSQTRFAVTNYKYANNKWNQGFWAVDLSADKDFSTVELVPSDNVVINLGSSSYKWKNLYSFGVSANVVETYPGADGLVLRSTDQTWENGSRIFLYSNTHTGQTNGSLYFDVDHGDGNNTKSAVILLPGIFYPVGGGTNGIKLGDSTHKWKTFNGINPGALSFPNVGAETDFSGDVIPPTGESGININGGLNTYTPEFDGWISIRYNHATLISVVRGVALSFGNVLSLPSAGEITLSMPVIANVTYQIRIIATETNKYTHFYFTKSKGDPTNP